MADIEWRQWAAKQVAKMTTEHMERRELCLENLWIYAQTMNPHYAYADIHRKLYMSIQDSALFGTATSDKDGEDVLGTNKLILVPRAHLKSHVVATATSWLITKYPELTVLYGSATAELAEQQLFAIKTILTSPQFSHFFPEYVHPEEGKREMWNSRKIMIDHPKREQEGIRDPSIATAGLTTNTTGWHADLICLDDLVIPENAYTAEGRSQVKKKASQFVSIRNPGGFTLAAGTRYHPDDIYNAWKEQMVDIWCEETEDVIGKEAIWDVEEHVVETDSVFLWPRTRMPNGKVYGFNMQVLNRIKAEYIDQEQFYAQYYNDPNSMGSEMLDGTEFQYLDRAHLKYMGGSWFANGKRLNVYAAMDFAYTVKKKSDYTAIAVVGMDCDGFYYVLDLIRFKTNSIHKMYEKLMEAADEWRFKKVRAECVAAQSIIAQDLKNKIREEGKTLVVEDWYPPKGEGSKEERIKAALEPRYKNRSIFHIKGGYTPMLEEEVRLARPAHDDLKDAVANAITIARKPAKERDNEANKSNVRYGRFGGVAFGR